MRLRRTIIHAVFLPALAAMSAAGGCTGNYILTVPDQIAPAGGQAVAVVRLQRSEIALLALPVKDALIWFRAGADEKGRGAYTDDLGYAGTTVAVPVQPGKFVFRVFSMDRQGDEVYQEVPLYVWDANRPAIAVDIDSLPSGWTGEESAAARQGLARLARDMNVCYMTRRPVTAHRDIHRELEQAGLPDGAILLWQQEQWHIVREGFWQVPRVVVESRLVNQLALLRKMLPGLSAGLTDTTASAKTFAEAGMRIIMIGSAAEPGIAVTRLPNWKELALRGI